MAEQKEKQQQQPTNKRSQSNSKTDESHDQEKSSSTKRPRIEYEQTGYNRGLVPEMLMGATDIYDGELMFL